MNPYTVIGVRPAGGEVMYIAAVLDGHHRTVDTGHPALWRWAGHVHADSPAGAERIAQQINDYGGLVENRAAGELRRGDRIVYDDGGCGEIVTVASAEDGTVWFWLDHIDSAIGDEPARYEESALVSAVLAEEQRTEAGVTARQSQSGGHVIEQSVQCSRVRRRLGGGSSAEPCSTGTVCWR